MDSGSRQVLTYLLVIAFACVEGITHAILWSRKGSYAFKWNEHVVFVVSRILFGGAIMLAGSWSGLIAGGLAYPFFHNGFYYSWRNKIDGSYPDKFTAQSETSSARFNFGFTLRLILSIVSVAVMIFLFIHK